MFINEVHTELSEARAATFVVAASRSTFRGEKSLTLYGHDFEVEE